MESKKDFFISYNKEDKQWAKWIAGTLEENGFTTIIQAWDFRPGNNFVLEMHQALKESKHTIIVMSQNYFDSAYCQSEWAAAFSQDPNSKKRILIPIRVTDVYVDGLLQNIIYIDLFEVKNEKIAEKMLLHAVDEKSIPRKKPAYPNKSEKARFPNQLSVQLSTKNLPFRRNLFFSGRDAILEEINQNFQKNHLISLVQIISGLGGVGKTQTALEYAYRYAEQYDCIWWVHAENTNEILSDYREHALEYGLIDDEMDNMDMIVKKTTLWMSQNDRWLFIFDNAMDQRSLYPFLPKSHTGHILITSRTHQWDRIGTNIPIELFNEKEAVRFLVKRTRISDHAGAAQLSKALGYLPLALDQAASYISEMDIDYHEYLKLFHTYKLDLFEENKNQMDYELTVNITWNISIENIEHEGAKQLLYLCSYYAPDHIDLDLLIKNNPYLPSPLKEDVKEERRFHQILSEVKKYSLIKVKENNITIHRLLQEVIKRSLEPKNDYIDCCVKNINEIIPEHLSTREDREHFLALVPHGISVLDHEQPLDHSLEEEIDLYFSIASGFNDLAMYEDALKYHKRLQKICETIQGKEHPDTATTYNINAGLYDDLGDYETALSFYRKALTIREKVLGEEHPDTAKTYNNIALVYDSQGDSETALSYYRKALAIYEKVWGEEHPDTAAVYNNIALIYNELDDYETALSYYRKALAIQEKVLGEENSYTATTYNNIAGAYFKQGDYETALSYYRKALAIYEKVWGEEHPNTAATYNNIALIYDSQGDYEKALSYHQKALTIREKVLGEEHPDTAITYNNIAGAYFKQGDYETALSYYRKALTIREKVLGEEHPDTKIVSENIKILLQKKND